MKAAGNVKTPAQYLASLPTERRADVAALHKAICKVVPALKPQIAYGMIGYGSDKPAIALASQKQHISLYICSGSLAEKNKARLGKVSVGKSCIRFKRLEDLNLPVALELVRRAAAL